MILDEQLTQLIDTLSNTWFTQSIDIIQALEQQAQNQATSVLLHDYLAKYFHLAGDYQKAAFYAVHREPLAQLDQKDLFSHAITQTILDYYIYKHGGSLNGTCVSLPEQNSSTSYNTTYNKYQNSNTAIYGTKSPGASIQQNIQKKPFYMLDLINSDDKINSIIQQIITNSSTESVLSFKLHTKQLKLEEIDKMSAEQLELLNNDICQIDDEQYKNQILKHLTVLYQNKGMHQSSVDCAIQLRSDIQFQFDYLNDLIKAGKLELALQAAFCYYEQINSFNISEIQFKFNQLKQEEKTPIHVLIVKEVLSGKITTQLLVEFMQNNQRIDKTALREIAKSAENPESIAQCFLMHSLMALSTLQYEHKKTIVEKLTQYPVFGFYANIGLIFRGHFQLPQVYTKLFENVNNVDPYQLGGAILGMCYMLVGMNMGDNNGLVKLLDINDSLDTIDVNKRGPVVHGLAFATGLVALAQSSEDINQILYEKLSDDVDANYAVLVGLGLVNFGNYQFFNSDMCREHVLRFLSSERERERIAAALCLALLCYKQENKAQEIIQFLLNYSSENPSQFADSVEYYSCFALGLAYFQTENVNICQQLLLLSNKYQRTTGAKQAIQAIGFILKPSQQSFQLLQMCCKSFDGQVRSAACSTIGQLFATTGNPKAVELLCKMMGDQEEIVRTSAIIAQAFVVQAICGAEIPDAQKIELGEPVGDRQKNCIYKCDYKDDEFEKIKNFQKVLRTPGSLQDRYKENYTAKLPQPLQLNQYVTQFRRDLVREDETHLMTQRAQFLALGILNAGGLNMSFKLRTDLQIASYVLFLQSFSWYQLQGILGLCMEADFTACVSLDPTTSQLNKEEPIFSIPNSLLQKYGYSVLSKEVKATELEQYVHKARLSQQDLKDAEKAADRFKFMRDVRNIAVQEFIKQANNVKLADVLAGKEEKTEKQQDEFEIIQAPTRIVEGMMSEVQFIANNGFELVYEKLKRGVLLVIQEKEEQ